MMQESVWVVADAAEGAEAAGPVLEALTPACAFARAWGGGVRVLLFASAEVPSGQTETLLAHGAARVSILHHADMAEPATDVRVRALDEALARARPRVLLVATPQHAASWAVRLAARRRLPVVTRSLELVLSPTGVRARREAFGGSAHVTLEIPMEEDCAPAIFLLEPGSWALPGSTGTGSGGEAHDEARIEVVELSAGDLRVGVTVDRIRWIMPAAGEVDLEHADLVLAGGAGLGSSEGFAELRETARMLGGAVGATRLAVDHGWARAEEQIGLTGRQVAPLVYLAFGLSGAREHLSGVANVRNVVAVNTDASAPIASVSRLFAVADARVVLGALRAEARERVASARARQGVESGVS